MGVIYCVTCKPTGQKYIGLTKHSAYGRWTSHVKQAQQGSQTKFHRAIRKHGPRAFRLRVLETCDDAKLAEREIYWIAKHNTYRRGLNGTPGGETGFNQRRRFRWFRRQRRRKQPRKRAWLLLLLFCLWWYTARQTAADAWQPAPVALYLEGRIVCLDTLHAVTTKAPSC